MTKAERNAAIINQHRAGSSLRAIGRDIGLSHEAVRQVLIAYGLVMGRPKPPKPDKPAKPGRPRRIDVRKAWRLLRYHPLSVVADAMKVGQDELLRALHRHGLPAYKIQRAGSVKI